MTLHRMDIRFGTMFRFDYSPVNAIAATTFKQKLAEQMIEATTHRFSDSPQADVFVFTNTQAGEHLKRLQEANSLDHVVKKLKTAQVKWTELANDGKRDPNSNARSTVDDAQRVIKGLNTTQQLMLAQLQHGINNGFYSVTPKDL